MSDKNLLQEYCQKNCLSLPIYTTIQSSITPPLFTSYVQLNNQKYGPTTGNNKRESEKCVASIALENIDKNNEINKILYTGDPICLLVDIENKHKILNELENKFKIQKSNIFVYVFLSRNHHLMDKLTTNSWYNLIVVDSIRNDASDTMLIFKAGELCQKYKKIYVVTGDHFGQTLVEILATKNIESKLINKIDEII